MSDKKHQFYIQQFRDALFKVDRDLPWYIQSISGLDELYKIDVENNYRGVDKKITLTFLEDVKLQMTYIFDLYRKSVWDAKYMRWKVPENMRKFGMEIYIVDIRNFQTKTIPGSSDASTSWDWFDPTRPLRAVDTLRGNLKGAIADIKTKVMSGSGNELNDDLYYDPSNTRAEIERLPADDFLPILKLELDDCEFELVQDGLSGFDDISNTVGGEPREVSLTINIGNIREVNQYSLFNIVLDDHGSMYEDLLQTTKDMYKVAKDMSDKDKPKKLLERQRKNPLLEKIKNRALQETIGRLSDKAKQFINPFLLGNIYGVSPTDVQNTIDNVLNNNNDNNSSTTGKNIHLDSVATPHTDTMPENIDFKEPAVDETQAQNIDFEDSNTHAKIRKNIELDESYTKHPINPKNIWFSGPST
jgi:hypothetical protein